MASVLGPRDRLDEAQAALGRTSALLPPDAPGRPLLDFRRGLVAENLLRDPTAAWIAYRRAHDGARAHGDELLTSYTWRHLAALALAGGDTSRAREGFAASLELREQLGFTVGVCGAGRARRGVGARRGGPAAGGGGTAGPGARGRTGVARAPAERGARAGCSPGRPYRAGSGGCHQLR